MYFICVIPLIYIFFISANFLDRELALNYTKKSHHQSILVMWLECWFLDTEVDSSNHEESYHFRFLEDALLSSFITFLSIVKSDYFFHFFCKICT